MKYLRLLFLITALVTIIFNNIEGVNIVLLIAATSLAIIFTTKYPFRSNYAKYLVLMVFWFSVIFMPSFHLVDPLNTRYLEINQLGLDRLLNFGVPVFFEVILLILLISAGFRKNNYPEVIYHPRPIKQSSVNIFIVFCILLSFFCISIGLGRMGSEGVRLPFHLGGFINLFRRFFVPYIFAVIIENFILTGRKIPRSTMVLYLVWCIVEIFAWLSKSVFVEHLEPVLLLLYFYYRPTAKKVLVFMAPLLIFFLVMYPIVEAMRTMDSASMSERISSAKDSSDDSEGGGNALLAPLNRTFMTGFHYVNDYDYLNHNELFDFSKVPLLVFYGGAAGYQTFYIDQYPTGVAHSSGTTGLLDPYLHGGRGLLYMMIFIWVIYSVLLDKSLNKGRCSVYTILFLLLWELSNNQNISSLYDAIGLQRFFISALAIFFAYRMNFRRLINLKNRE